MKYCNSCGKQMEKGTSFCSGCGAKIFTEKNKTGSNNKGYIMVLLWVIFLPIMAIIAIVKSEKFSKKVKAILVSSILIFCFIFVISSNIESQKAAEQAFSNLKITVESKDYLKAQEEINKFLKGYSTSKYVDEVKAVQVDVNIEAEKIKSEQKAEANRLVAEKKIEDDRLAVEKKAEADRIAAEKKAEADWIAAEKKAAEEKAAAEKKINEAATKAGITVQALSNMYSACQEIGIEIEKISSLLPVENWANGKRCKFVYSEYSFVTYFNQDESINSINSGTVKFFENGGKVANLNDRLLSSNQKVQIKIWAEDSVKSVLKAPTTAKFPGGFLSPYESWQFGKDGNVYTVSSYVDSQNSFGAMIRSNFTIQYQWTEGEDGKTIAFVFDGQKLK